MLVNALLSFPLYLSAKLADNLFSQSKWVITMRLSISSSGYNWYVYKGTRTKFSNHNDDYDLELKPNEIIGVKGKIVIHKDEPKIKFVFTPTELNKLIKTCAPLDYDHNLYPKLALPCSKTDVARVYAFFNEKLFAGECPKDVVFRKLNSSKTHGRAIYKFATDTMEFVFSSLSMTNVPEFCNMVVHEMIHLLHYKRAYRDKDAMYEDSAHGPLFIRDMKRLNSLGYSVQVTKKDYSTDALQNHVYIAQFKDSASENTITLHSQKEFDPKDVLRRLAAVYRIACSEYVYGKTTDPLATRTNKLTTSGTIPKGRRLSTKGFSLANVEILHKETVIDVSSHKQDTQLKKAMLLSDYNLDNSLAIYFGTVQAQYPEAKLEDVEKNWAAITDDEILKGHVFKNIKRQLLIKRLDKEDALKYLVSLYSVCFKSRLTKERFAELCAKYFDIITMPHNAIVKGLIKILD